MKFQPLDFFLLWATYGMAHICVFQFFPMAIVSGQRGPWLPAPSKCTSIFCLVINPSKKMIYDWLTILLVSQNNDVQKFFKVVLDRRCSTGLICYLELLFIQIENNLVSERCISSSSPPFIYFVNVHPLHTSQIVQTIPCHYSHILPKASFPSFSQPLHFAPSFPPPYSC